jgi:putative membrane protein insertion efficiency factor
MRTVLLLILSGYRKIFSPWFPPACRFYPSCSAYTQEAIQKFGVVRGVTYGLGRLVRCHPWHPGGYDPVR